RQKDIADDVSAGSGIIEVLLDITLRINDGSSFGAFIGNQIGCVCEAAEIVLFEDQGCAFRAEDQLRSGC
ncbi:MAG: hypothetical protein ACK56E_17360, partial [Planctomyces sp.]